MDERYPNLKYHRVVPCPAQLQRGPCSGEFDVSDLHRRKKPTIECPKCETDFSIGHLLNGFGIHYDNPPAMSRLEAKIDLFGDNIQGIKNTVTEINFRHNSPCPRLFRLEDLGAERKRDIIYFWRTKVLHRYRFMALCELTGKAGEAIEFTRPAGWIAKLAPASELLTLTLSALQLTVPAEIANAIQHTKELIRAAAELSGGYRVAIPKATGPEGHYAGEVEYRELCVFMEEIGYAPQFGGLVQARAPANRRDQNYDRWLWMAPAAVEQVRIERHTIPDEQLEV